MGDLRKTQEEIGEWAYKNFGVLRGFVGSDQVPGFPQLLGIMEEVGELAHAHLKQYQGIRGDTSKHVDEAEDAIGDILIFLMDYCAVRGFDLETILKNTWAVVKKRDWAINNISGAQPIENKSYNATPIESTPNTNPAPHQPPTPKGFVISHRATGRCSHCFKEYEVTVTTSDADTIIKLATDAIKKIVNNCCAVSGITSESENQGQPGNASKITYKTSRDPN